MRRALNNKPKTAQAMLGLLPVLAGYVFYHRWLELFPQIEFRTWMWSEVGLKWYLTSAFTNQGAFSRSSPFLLDSLTRSVCGQSIRCVNEPGFWTILLAGYLLFWLIVRLTRRPIAAAVASTLWILSLPVLDAFDWQATLGDRLAVLFGLATIHVAISAMRRINEHATRMSIPLANFAVLIPAILTYNCKEISWVLLPSLVLLAFALARQWSARIIARHLSVLVATALYAIFRTIDTFVLVGESPTSNNLDFGGEPIHNIKLYLAYLSNRLYLTTIPHLLTLAALAGALAVTAVAYRSANHEVRVQARVVAWALLSLLGGLILCIFTPYPSPYLLLLPSVFLWVMLVSLWRAVPLPRSVRPIAGVVAAGGVAAVMLIGLNGSYTVYGETLAWSRNFRKSLPDIARHVPVGAPTDFVIGEAPFLAYRFVGDEGQRYIDQFLYGLPRPIPSMEATMNNVPSIAPGFTGFSVILGNNLAVSEITAGSRVVYRATSDP